MEKALQDTKRATEAVAKENVLDMVDQLRKQQDRIGAAVTDRKKKRRKKKSKSVMKRDKLDKFDPMVKNTYAKDYDVDTKPSPLSLNVGGLYYSKIKLTSCMASQMVYL